MNGTLVEVLKFIVYSGVGFLAGYQVCKTRRNTEEIKEAMMDDDPNEAAPSVKEERRETRQTRIIGIVVLILSAITIGQSIYFGYQRKQDLEHDQERTACQAQYNEDFARAVTIRGQYADEDRMQLYKMITTVLNQGLTPEQRRQAVEEWVAASQRNDVLRKKTPLPDLEARNC